MPMKAKIVVYSFGPPPTPGVYQEPFPPLEPPMAMQISAEEQAHQAMLRQRSYELAIARGHIRR